jgi:hypothetical protein
MDGRATLAAREVRAAQKAPIEWPIRWLKCLLSLVAIAAFALVVLPYAVLLLPLGILLFEQEMWVRGTLFLFLSAYEYGPAPSFVRQPFFAHPLLLTSLQWSLMAGLTIFLVQKRLVRSEWLAALLVCSAAALLALVFILSTGVRLDQFKT